MNGPLCLVVIKKMFAWGLLGSTIEVLWGGGGSGWGFMLSCQTQLQFDAALWLSWSCGNANWTYKFSAFLGVNSQHGLYMVKMVKVVVKTFKLKQRKLTNQCTKGSHKKTKAKDLICKLLPSTCYAPFPRYYITWFATNSNSKYINCLVLIFQNNKFSQMHFLLHQISAAHNFLFQKNVIRKGNTVTGNS